MTSAHVRVLPRNWPGFCKRQTKLGATTTTLFLPVLPYPATANPMMLTQLHRHVPFLASICQPRCIAPRYYATRERTSDRIPTNDPSPPAPVQNVSESNAVPISPLGMRDSDRPLQEMPENSEHQRAMQAPNRKEPWSRSQQPRERAMSGPRFEQTIMEYQVCCGVYVAFCGILPHLADRVDAVTDAQ